MHSYVRAYKYHCHPTYKHNMKIPQLLPFVVQIQDFCGYVHLYIDFNTIMIRTIIMWITGCSSFIE
jgi:hypothetical protein